MKELNVDKFLEWENRFIDATHRFPPGRSMPMEMAASEDQYRATREELWSWIEGHGLTADDFYDELCEYCKRPCQDHPYCPRCGYTACDCEFHGDHHLCPEPDPPAPEPLSVNGRRFVSSSSEYLPTTLINCSDGQADFAGSAWFCKDPQ
jgi:hypothetical protein